MSAPYDLTILSIFRDAAGYLDTYLSQLRAVLPSFGHARLCWLEGDSADDTRERLRVAAREFVNDFGAAVSLTRLDTGGPYWPSIDHADRWQQLATCWNANLAQLKPTRLAVCVESDLVWSADALTRCAAYVTEGVADVMSPLLMCGWHPSTFYDTHATILPDGRPFSHRPPYVPDHDGSRLVRVATAGGLIVTTGERLAQARWGEHDCILHFPEGTDWRADLETTIVHPRRH